MKALTLINPVRRGRRGRFVRTSLRRRRVRRNPVRARRRRRRRTIARVAPIRRHRSRRRVVSRRRIRRRARRTTMAIMRRPARSIRRHRRRRHGRRMVRSFRRRGRRSSGGLGRLGIKSILSRQNLEIAGGAIGAGFLTTYVVGRFGASLPMITNNWVRMGYKLAIPVVGASLVKRFNRNLAQGMILGGIITVLNDLISSFLVPATTATTGAYLNATPSSAFGAYLGAPQAQRRFTPSYNAVNSFGASPRSVYASPSAFKGSAW